MYGVYLTGRGRKKTLARSPLRYWLCTPELRWQPRGEMAYLTGVSVSRLIPLRYWLCTPELRWQPRGEMAYLTGRVHKGCGGCNTALGVRGYDARHEVVGLHRRHTPVKGYLYTVCMYTYRYPFVGVSCCRDPDRQRKGIYYTLYYTIPYISL
jgi:hypothetical protein